MYFSMHLRSTSYCVFQPQWQLSESRLVVFTIAKQISNLRNTQQTVFSSCTHI